jgi:hypothetical protein
MGSTVRAMSAVSAGSQHGRADRGRRLIGAFVLGAVLSVAAAVNTAPAAAADVAATRSRHDQAILKAAALRQSDVPRGLGPSQLANDIPQSVPKTGPCALADTTVPQRYPRPFVGETSSGSSARVEDATYVFRDAAAAGGALDVFHAATAMTCLQATQQDLLMQSGSELTVVGTSPIPEFAGVGDDSTGYEMVAADQDQTMTLYTDVVAVRVGRAVLVFKFETFDEAFAQRRNVVHAVATRVEHLTNR